jgi:hypothetical protein
MPNELSRFNAKISDPNEQGCRLWTGSISTNGFPLFHRRRPASPRTVQARRFLLQDEISQTINHVLIKSKCESSLCMTRSHLIVTETRDGQRHKITQVDEINKRGKCSSCGISTVYKRDTGTWQGWACENARKYRARVAGLVARYGLSLEKYGEILSVQEGVCFICKDPPEENSVLVVDHDHSCCPGKEKTCGTCIRGLLCGKCNSALGYFRDDPELMERAAQYVRQSSFVR